MKIKKINKKRQGLANLKKTFYSTRPRSRTMIRDFLTRDRFEFEGRILYLAPPRVVPIATAAAAASSSWPTSVSVTSRKTKEKRRYKERWTESKTGKLKNCTLKD